MRHEGPSTMKLPLSNTWERVRQVNKRRKKTPEKDDINELHP